jgi:GTPase
MSQNTSFEQYLNSTNKKFNNPPKARQIKEENDEGNIEYKYRLCEFSTPFRISKLVTQLNYRLFEGNGKAIYNIGFMDDGTPKGLPMDQILASLGNLYKMCAEVKANLESFRAFQGESGYCANVYITKTMSSTFEIIPLP